MESPMTQAGCLGVLIAVLIAVYAGGALALEITPVPAFGLLPEANGLFGQTVFGLFPHIM
jgi:hypothetical protein